MLTDKQVAARKNGIGASEVVILFPEIPNPYSTPYQLWMEKTGRIERDSSSMNDFQWWGHALEPAIAARYEYETGETLHADSTTVIHPKLSFMLCHPDRYDLINKVLIEFKTANFLDEQWGASGTDQVPPGYVIQVQSQLACLPEYKRADLMAFFLNYRKSHIYHFRRDEVLIGEIEKRVSHFWNHHVLADNPPEMTSVSDCKSFYAKNNDEWVEIDEQAGVWLKMLNEAREDQRRGDSCEKECLKYLMNFIGNATGIKDGDQIVATWKCDVNGTRRFNLSKKYKPMEK